MDELVAWTVLLFATAVAPFALGFGLRWIGVLITAAVCGAIYIAAFGDAEGYDALGGAVFLFLLTPVAVTSTAIGWAARARETRRRRQPNFRP